MSIKVIILQVYIKRVHLGINIQYLQGVPYHPSSLHFNWLNIFKLTHVVGVILSTLVIVGGLARDSLKCGGWRVSRKPLKMYFYCVAFHFKGYKKTSFSGA